MSPSHPKPVPRLPRGVLHLLVFLACLAPAPLAVAQTMNVAGTARAAGDLVFRSWGTQEGMPQNSVNAVVQSRDGYLWLGTHEGLARFDGVRFRLFGLREGLPSLDVRVLLEDRHGTLWIGTSGGGLSRLDGDHIQNIPMPLRTAAAEIVTALAEDADGRLWVGTRAGVAVYDGATFLTNNMVASIERHLVYALAWDPRGSMWVATSGAGLLECRGNQVAESQGPEGHEQISAYCLLVDQAGHLWASIGNGQVLCRRDGVWGLFNQADGLPFEYITCMMQEKDGTIWLGSLDRGLYRYEDGRFLGIPPQDGLAAADIRCLLSDRERNLWVGTRTGGLIRGRRRQFITYGVAQGLTNDFTRSVAETSDGELWVGTIGGGLYRGSNGRFEQTASEGDEPRHAFVYSVLATQDDSVWYGANFGLFRAVGGEIQERYLRQPWIRSDAVTALCADTPGALWIGTSGGRLVHFADGEFNVFPQRIARGVVTALAREPDGDLWVGSDAGGLRRVRLGEDRGLAITNGLATRAIRTLYLDHDGTLWIGSTGGGLGLWRNGKLTSITTRQGLETDTISQIIEDDFGDLWLGTSRGIYRIRKTELNELASGERSLINPRSYGVNEGMPTDECSSGFSPAGLKTRTGLLCFPTVKGLVLVDPRKQETDSPPPEVLLEEIRVGGQVYVRRAPPGARASEVADEPASDAPMLPHVIVMAGDLDVELDYTAISFAAPEKVRFRYRLKGLDSDWTEAGTRRSAYYHGIPIGEYQFEISVCSASSQWSTPVVKARITVWPRLWQTAWFRGAVGLAILGALAGVVRVVERRRYKRRLARLEMLHAVERERLRISQDMHDHVGSMLTQVSMASDLGVSESGLRPQVKGHFERIGQQTRAAVQALDEIVWASNPKNDNLPRFAEYVGRFTDECFEFSSIRCWQDMPTQLPNVPLRADVRHNVFSAVKEALNNVLKHSGATEVALKLTVLDSGIVLTIRDNGHGFDSAKIGPGSDGLENMRNRLDECGGSAEVISKPGHGTEVHLRFPFQEES